MKTPTTGRKEQIVTAYLTLLDKHMLELKTGQAERTEEIGDFAKTLHIHPRHLSNTIHEVLNCSPCNLYEERLLAIAQEMLTSHKGSIASIARTLFYDPSNFTKFFKTYTGITPGEYRRQQTAQKTEVLTMIAS
jgi:AraC family transcriptional regulator, regulatory protein of adaptative response / methylphosphotriester-DNA alkyltransferase methyltransferase